MSWYSDKEPFNEYDYPWCESCDGGESKEECDKCCERHNYERAVEQMEYDILYEPTYDLENGSM